VSGYLYGLQGENFYNAATLEGIQNQEALLDLAEESNALQQRLLDEQRSTRNTIIRIQEEAESARLRDRNRDLFAREFEYQGYAPLDAAKLANLEVSLLEMPGMVDYELFKFRKSAEELIKSHREKIIKSINLKMGTISVGSYAAILLMFFLSFKGQPGPSLIATIFFLISNLALLVYVIKCALQQSRVKKMPPEEFNDVDFDNLVSNLKASTLIEIERLISFIKPPGGSRLYDYSKLLETLEKFRIALIQGE
jgi:hypothetical protein